MNTFINFDWLEFVLCGEWNSRCLVYEYSSPFVLSLLSLVFSCHGEDDRGNPTWSSAF